MVFFRGEQVGSTQSEISTTVAIVVSYHVVFKSRGGLKMMDQT